MAHEEHASSPPPDRKSIERFVRVTLGCKCPDEVFRSIAIDRVGAGDTSGVGVGFVRLAIGGRLLIHVLESRDGGAASRKDVACDWPELVAALARAGLAERDALGFNRFRLVVASTSPLLRSSVTQPDVSSVARHETAVADRQIPGEALRQAFTSVAGMDDRAHLHLVDTSELPVELRRL